ncbi:MAG: hypothetical protein HKL82_12790 [Acidimicrobiaceae bacterium]|nr:hypothetical protein [Acidimicrobiaceae bacterium]
MGLLDKVKVQAQTVTQTAKEAAQKGQERIEDLQQKRAVDSLLKDLGTVTYQVRAGRMDTVKGDSESNRLIDAIKAHEAEHGDIS